MGIKVISAFALLCLVALINIQGAQSWRGNTVQYRTWRWTSCRRCICRYWWGCSWWRWFSCTRYYWATRCKAGYTHNGNQNCIIPICRPSCANGGTCIRPNECQCPEGVEGRFCQTLLCAYARPCYPGNCYSNNKCNCTEGFDKISGEYGCLKMEESEKPVIGRSTAIIEYIRRTDNKELYYFLLDGTDETLAAPVWSNQNRFNLLSFEFEAQYEQIEQFPERPTYVHDVKLGIVKATVRVVPRFFNGSIKGTPYNLACDGVGDANPEEEIFNCTISRQDYVFLVEHGDTMTATYTAYSGGYRKMISNGQFQDIEFFTQVSNSKQVVFKFDFIAPRHCSEENAYSVCSNTSTPLAIKEEFTKGAINVRWEGWADESYGSGLWIYYFEVHRLVNKNPATGTLTEENPINPLKSFNLTAAFNETNFDVTEPGMYSILMETRDISNNSKWTRSLVCFDDSSSITLNIEEGKMFFISSANPGTNYTWQTSTENEVTEFVVEWANHFRNAFHDENLLLNKVDKFPIMFAEVEDSGTLSTSKYVSDVLDDHVGKRTVEAINHKHGIVRFEYNVVTTQASTEPMDNWRDVSPLEETVTFSEQLLNGAEVKIWVRAHDMMGNVKADFTTVRVDSTAPKLSDANNQDLSLNVNGTFTHTSRINCAAQDPESGVYEIGIDIAINGPDMETETFTTRVPANTDPNKDSSTDPDCVASRDPNTCFIKEQEIELDNCWFMIEDRLKLVQANATIKITAYNQALLSKSNSYTVTNLTRLSGISVYSGPTNFGITNVDDTGFRLTWDLPDKESCYGKANILILIFEVAPNGNIELSNHVVPSTATFFDFGGLKAEKSYLINLGSQLPNGQQSALPSVQAATVAPVETGIGIGVIVGVVVGILVIIAIVVVVMIILVRRGVLHPVDQARNIKRRATTRIRKTIYGEQSLGAHENKGYTYDNRKSEIYIYGDVNFDGPQAYHIDRNDITFETLIKSGQFANIYKAVYKKSKHSSETVVAKTLKENFTSDDEKLMKAKINFTGSATGEHPNVLKFIGAVVDDPAMGPFIVSEYCEHGPLKDYLKSQKSNVTLEMQDNLFRFGLDIARGMEYLAAKNIVHRRLAARNILLTFLNEIKISGFGPQPLNGEEEDAEQGKKERIPIKWMAPECMKSTAGATEKSDVWSYAVVLWEIFSLGEDPYTSIRGRDLPSKVKNGYRLPKPEQCDETWYGVMNRCWHNSADKRPSFVEIRNELDSMFIQAPGDEDYYTYKR